jgi:hypothetical protein
MSTPQQVAKAKARMRSAEAALRAYAERPKTEPVDLKKHKRLVRELDEAMGEYLRQLSKLGQ